jgi:RNA methyltransferase, TrmH family
MFNIEPTFSNTVLAVEGRDGSESESMDRIHNRKDLKQNRRDLRSNATAAEAALWNFLKGSQLGKKFRRQHSIGNYIVDFYCPSERLVIELDGDGHFSTAGYLNDEKRTNYLNSLGIRVVRFQNDEVFKATEAILEKIKSSITTPDTSLKKEGSLDSPPLKGGVPEGRGGYSSIHTAHPREGRGVFTPTSRDTHFRITSTQNPKVKSLLALEKPRERRKQQLFIIEGKKEISMALEAGYKIGNLFFCDEIVEVNEIPASLKDDKLLIPVSKDVFDKIAVREGTGGMIAVAEMRLHSLEQIALSQNPLVLILEGVEKPGNLGAILRTADAANVDAVIICDPQTDFYNSNVIRSSVGCVFTKQVASATSEETIAWLKKNNIQIYCTYLKASQPYHAVDYKKPSAIIMGTEATGLTDVWVKNSNANIIIPMLGKIDSMNVSTAAAVVVFEARRQRGF